MVVFEYTDLGRNLRGSVIVCYGCAHLGPQSSFVMSVVKSPLYFEALKTWYVLAKIQTIQAEWRFIVCFLSLLSHGYPNEFFCQGVWLPVSMIKLLCTRCITLEREKCLFSN